MSKPKRKLTAAQRAARKRRREEFMTIFVNGKQKRVRRPPTVDGLPVNEFIERNADPIWLHQKEMWDMLEDKPFESGAEPTDRNPFDVEDTEDIPF